MTIRRIPDAAALRRWLLGPEIAGERGAIRSWAPGGYDYPEAGGLWLSWLAACAPDHARGDAVAAWLSRAIDADAVGRDGVGYTFDLGVVLTGLLRWSTATATPPSPSVIHGATRLVEAIAARRALTSGTAAPRWSTRFGGHLGKLALALDALDAARIVDTADARASLAASHEHDDGAVYMHARLYALEGAWVRGDAEAVAQGAGWLAEIQRHDGAIAARWDPARGPDGAGRSDATAQAVRLWCAADPSRFAAAIERALSWLAGLQTDSGAIDYDDRTAHRNVWCTLFTAQALAFATSGPDRGALL